MFCPVHGDYIAPLGRTACPLCSQDPIRSRASLRAVKIVSVSDAPVEEGGAIDPADALTEIEDRAPCPSCGRATALDKFQSEAPGEVWGGDTALWAEEGVCADCYANVIPGQLQRWSSADWLAHHFEGWRSQVLRVSEVFVHTDVEQDAWLAEEDRQKILDVEATLAARREHIARAQMRLRDIKAELALTDVPREFAAVLELASRALEPAAVALLKAERAQGLAREKVRREDSVATLSPLFEPDRAGPPKHRHPPSRDLPAPRSTPIDPRSLPPIPRAPLFAVLIVAALLLWWWASRA